MESTAEKQRMDHPNIVSHAEWIAARTELLNKEKEFTRLRDELSRQRRELPWEKVKKEYVFDGPNGKETLGDLFGGKSQLMIYHFMLGPGWVEGCPSCSFLADHFDGSVPHLAARDAKLVVVSTGAAGSDWRVQDAHGLAVQVGIVVRERFQSRLQRIVHEGRDRQRADVLQLRDAEIPERGRTRRERVLQG